MEDFSSLYLNETIQETGAVTWYRNDSDVRWCPVNENHEEDVTHKQFYKMAQDITGLIIYPLVCFPGVVGNALTIFVLSRRNMHSSTNAFLSALAVADAIKLLNDILYFFVIIFSKFSDRLGNLSYGYLYPYAHFIFSLSVCVSSWLTVSVAVERYILVCHPTRARAVCSRKRAVLLCSSIYIFMTSLALPSALRYRTIRCLERNTSISRLDVELTEMWENEQFVTVYTWIQNLMRSIIPLLLLIVLNACIISALRRTKAKKRKNTRHRITIMMIVVILVFLVCITPDAILSTVFGVGYHEAGYLARGIREITDSLLALNAGVNFIIYCAFNKVFRRSFTRICCPNTRQSTWVTELDESTYRRLSEAKSLLSSNNNSPPRQDTPPTIVTDNCHSPGGNLSTAQQVSEVKDNCNNDERKQTLKYSSLGQQSHFESSLFPTLSPHEQQQLHQHNSHPHRTSNGLKKSKNSIKCNRAKNRGNTVTFSDSVNVYKKDTIEEQPLDGGDLDKEDDEVQDLRAVGQAGKKSVTYCKLSPTVSSKYQNDLANRTDKSELKATPIPQGGSLSDAEQLANFQNCDGTDISHNIRFSDCDSVPVSDCDSVSVSSEDIHARTTALNKQTNILDTGNRVCQRDETRTGKRRRWMCFVEKKGLDSDSVSNPQRIDNKTQSNPSPDNKNSETAIQAPTSNSNTNSVNAENEKITRNGNIQASVPVFTSGLPGNILTTDL